MALAPNFFFIFRAVQFDHGLVDHDLIQAVQAQKSRPDDLFHVLNRFQDALAAIALGVLVP